jgi:hypothetical protein
MVQYTHAVVGAVAVFLTSLFPRPAAASDDLPYIFYAPPENSTENIYTAGPFSRLATIKFPIVRFYISDCTDACDKVDTCIGAAITLGEQASGKTIVTSRTCS